MPIANGWKTRARCHVLGHDVLHDGGVMRFDYVTGRVTDPAVLIPELFKEIDPTLISRVKAGDYIVAGRNFFAGKAHNNGMIAMKALGLRVLCESMPFRSFRAAIGAALPCLVQCQGILEYVHDGDEIEADFETGEVKNITTGESRTYPPMAPDIKAMLDEGGMKGLLSKWLTEHPELATPA
ncbi:Isopropylmalate/citramalate isomerase small subunit [soil metagenome]